jgi:hypothetical protein
VGHEERDVSFPPVIMALIGIALLTIVSAVLMLVLFRYLAAQEARVGQPPNPLARSFGRQLPPPPRLQPDPASDLHALRAEEDAVLQSYGWVDRNAGVARMPIERAMDLLVERGLPARTQERR